MRELSDAKSLELLERFKAGDRGAFDRLYLGWVQQVYAFVEVVLRNRDRAEEVTHDVFLSILRASESFEPAGESAFRSWLFTIARNAALSVREKESRSQPKPFGEEAEAEIEDRESEIESAIGWLQDPDLLTLVELLPEPQRVALFLRFSLDLNGEQIGDVMGRTANDVYQLQYRALHRLKRQLTRLGHRNLRRHRAPTLKRVKPLPVLGARRFALERTLRPVVPVRSSMSLRRREPHL